MSAAGTPIRTTKSQAAALATSVFLHGTQNPAGPDQGRADGGLVN